MKGQVAQIVVPKTQISATGAAWTASSWIEYTEKVPILPINRIIVTMFADNVSDGATYAELLDELISSVYVKSGKYGILYDIAGADLEQALRHFFGVPQLPVTGETTDGAERSISYMIPFSRYFGDEKVGLPAHGTGSLQVKHQMGTSSECDGADYKVEADCSKNPYKYILTMTTMTDTPAATGKKRYTLPSTGLLAGILLKTTTAYESGAIKEPKLFVDGEFVGLEWDTIPLKARNVFDRKIPIVGVDDTSPRLEEGLNNLEKYYAIDFGVVDGEPESDWMNMLGKKVELELNVGTAEALKIIPVIGVKV